MSQWRASVVGIGLQRSLGCHVRNVAVAGMDGSKDVQRRIGN